MDNQIVILIVVFIIGYLLGSISSICVSSAIKPKSTTGGANINNYEYLKTNTENKKIPMKKKKNERLNDLYNTLIPNFQDNSYTAFNSNELHTYGEV